MTLAEILTQLESDVSVRSHFGNLDAQRVQALIRVIRVLERQRDLYRKDARDAFDLNLAIGTDNQEVLKAYKGES